VPVLRVERLAGRAALRFRNREGMLYLADGDQQQLQLGFVQLHGNASRHSPSIIAIADKMTDERKARLLEILTGGIIFSIVAVVLYMVFSYKP
jgi:hypothetical protein